MQNEDFTKLISDLKIELLNGKQEIAIIGLTDTTLRIIESLSSFSFIKNIKGIYIPSNEENNLPKMSIPIYAISELEALNPEVIVIASDADKETLLEEALPFIKGAPKVIIAGYAHHLFHNPTFDRIRSQLLVPSLANGYPNTLIHIYQCLENAARLGLKGIVAEFGMFKGGTTMFISQVIEELGMNWPVIGFDTFNGFPPRRSPLDMYDHHDCVFTDLPTVKRYLMERNVEIVDGDIVETCSRLKNEDIVLSFIDTDNYTSAKAAIEIVREKTVVHGAIVFDHFTGTDRFRYTLGEKIAGKALLEDYRFLNLHSTGVFYRQL